MSGAAIAVLENPFPGLRPFREAEEYLFFGRESQVDRMVDKLAATRFLAVVGTSGSGKSSLVNCGLKPALHRGVMSSAGSSWCMVQFRPGGNPLLAMARAFADQSRFFAGYRPDGLSLVEIAEATLRMSSLGLADLYQYAHFGREESVPPSGEMPQPLRSRTTSEATNLLVVVDQFEELFRYGKIGRGSPDAYGVSGEAIAFVNLLLEAHAQQTYPIYIVLTMRSDFLGECSQFDGLPEVINDSQYLVPRLTREERREAISGPICVAGAQLSPVLQTRLVNDVGDNPDQLSILQHAINRTWAFWQIKDHGAGYLSLEHYENEKVGTMANALDRHAEEAFAELKTERQQKICEKIFKALTDKGTDSRGIRRPMPLKDLCEIAAASHEEVLPILDVFRDPSRSFLMPPISESLEPETVVDISHEILMRVWSRLTGWVDEEAQSASTYRRLAESAELYAARKAALWRDPDLHTTLEWKTREAPNAAWARMYRGGFESALSFLAASKQVRDQEKAEHEFERRWRRVTPYIAAAVFVVFMSISPRLSEYFAPRVRPVAKRMFKTHAATSRITSIETVAPSDISEVIINGFGVQLSAVICILGYLGLSFTGRRIYRRFAFARVAERVSTELPVPPKIELRNNSPDTLTHPEIYALTTIVDGVPVPADLRRILAAGFIDFVVLFMLLFMFFIVFAFLSGIMIALLSLHNDNLYTYVMGFYMIVWIPLLCILYPSLMPLSRMNGTIGDWICGIGVTDLSGRRPTFRRLLGRYFASLLSWLLLGLGFFIQPFTARKQTLHDLIAGTILVRTRSRRKSAPPAYCPPAYRCRTIRRLSPTHHTCIM